VVLVHGFTQTSRSWERVASDLESGFEIVACDLPGHGRSPIPGAGSGLKEAALALGEAGGSASYVGYSLGGRCCLQLALDAPGLVHSLVVVGAHPGISDEESRRLRREADESRAAALERGGDAAVPEFIDAWLAGPLFSHLTDDQSDRASRLENSAAGLCASLRTVGTGSQSPLWERLGALDMPVLVVAGALDEKFVAIGEATVAAIGENAELALVTGAGHAAPFERPGPFAALVRDFLGRGAQAPPEQAHRAIPNASRAPKTS